MATGLDVDELASEGFKPEDCEWCSFVGNSASVLMILMLAITVLKHNVAGPAQMEELRRLRARLEGAMKITEGELQKSVFE